MSFGDLRVYVHKDINNNVVMNARFIVQSRRNMIVTCIYMYYV